MLRNPPSVDRPRIWYPVGSGGSWLSYLVWCWQNNTVLDINLPEFDRSRTEANCKDFGVYFGLAPHHLPPNDTDICLGSDRAHLNILLNNILKKGSPLDVELSAKGCYNNTLIHRTWNLEWHLLVEDPKKFVSQVATHTIYPVEWNHVTKQACFQYLLSCYPPELQGDNYKTHPVVRTFTKMVCKHFTYSELSFIQKRQQAESVRDSIWIKFTPDTWCK